MVRAAALGYTIFDCSLPTRDARRHRLYRFLPGCDPGAQRTPYAPGEPFYDVLYALVERRAQAIRQAPWVERHFRPGKPL